MATISELRYSGDRVSAGDVAVTYRAKIGWVNLENVASCYVRKDFLYC